ncbi:hypothetical protein HDU96_008878 [Phlyctochytrium bullatum]|nr:hypothetical protein HDU96_008878 [Phlyctochytrium bullatum]
MDLLKDTVDAAAGAALNLVSDGDADPAGDTSVLTFLLDAATGQTSQDSITLDDSSGNLFVDVDEAVEGLLGDAEMLEGALLAGSEMQQHAQRSDSDSEGGKYELAEQPVGEDGAEAGLGEQSESERSDGSTVIERPLAGPETHSRVPKLVAQSFAAAAEKAKELSPVSGLFKGLITKSSMRFVRMTASFAFLFKLLFPLLRHHLRQQPPSTASDTHASQTIAPLTRVTRHWGHDATPAFLAGLASGLCTLFETPKNRGGYMQIAVVRALQGTVNSAAAKGLIWKPWYTEGIVFALSGASILYAAAIRSSTLSKGYLAFLLNTSGSNAEILDLNRRHVRALEGRGEGIVTDDLFQIIRKHGKTNVDASTAMLESFLDTLPPRPEDDPTLTQVLRVMPCMCVHPDHPHCARNFVSIFGRVARKIAPVYLALNLLSLVMKPKAAMNNPLQAIRRLTLSTVISSTFLGSCAMLFQAGICFGRQLVDWNILKHDSKYVYWFAGLAGASSIFIERSARHAELAVYCLPKAGQSVYTILVDRGVIRHVPGSETAAACLSFGVIMALYKTDPKSLVGIFTKSLDFVLGKHELSFESVELPATCEEEGERDGMEKKQILN